MTNTPEYYLKAEILFKPVSQWLQAGFGEIAENGFPILSIEEESYLLDSALSLSMARKLAQGFVNLSFMDKGVDIVDLDSVFIHPDTVIGAGTVIYPSTVIRADVEIGEGCSVGPFAYLRPHTRIGTGCKIGDFVEIKNSTLGEKVSVSHLTYIGDSDVGSRVNFGCGTVTVNYDGKNKFRTTIGNDAFIGCNTNLVAPVTVGDRAYTAAGSTIIEDVPDEALGIARERQVNKPVWKSPKRRAQALDQSKPE